MERMVKNSSKLSLQFSFLGSPTIEQNGELVNNFPTVKAKALLLLLAAEHIIHQNDQIPKEKIVDLLWHGMPLSSALQNLRQTIYQIRKILSQDNAGNCLISNRKHLSLNSDLNITSDLGDWYQKPPNLESIKTIENLHPYLQQRNGVFLEHFSISGSPPFDEWIWKKPTIDFESTAKLAYHLRDHLSQQKQWRKSILLNQALIDLDPFSDNHHQKIGGTLSQEWRTA